MKDKIANIVKQAVEALRRKGELRSDVPLDYIVEIPKNPSYGDYASAISMQLAKGEGKPPFEIANLFLSYLKEHVGMGEVKVVKPGFLNFTLSHDFLINELKGVIKLNDRYGKSDRGKGKRVLLEYVSANPTGPLHVGHGRWAVIGDAISRSLKEIGYRVDNEFYVNDMGKQLDLLCRSVIARSEGSDVPEGGYGGEYVVELANNLKEHLDDKALGKTLVKTILSEQNKVLLSLGVKFDRWYYESDLYKKKLVAGIISALKDKGATFDENGALWFKSKEYGDDKNRVLIREDGAPTYFTADIAYHLDKFKRGYGALINVWGTDHHGYVARLKAALKVLGLPAENLKIIIGQLVSLVRGGVPVRMSKRTGEMITLGEVVEEIGADATRFFFLMLSPDSHLEFDLELAKRQTPDNPVYYVQYAHARISGILGEAAKAGYDVRRAVNGADLALLKTADEITLIRKILSYPDEVLEAALANTPHRLIAYSRELAAVFHNFYHKLRVISDDKKTTEARLALVFATRIVLRNVLKLLGISLPERM